VTSRKILDFPACHRSATVWFVRSSRRACGAESTKYSCSTKFCPEGKIFFEQEYFVEEELLERGSEARGQNFVEEVCFESRSEVRERFSLLRSGEEGKGSRGKILLRKSILLGEGALRVGWKGGRVFIAGAG